MMKVTVTAADMLVAFVFVTLNVGVSGWIGDGKNFVVACPSIQTSSPRVNCIMHIMGSEGTQINITGTMTGLPKTETISSALLLKNTVQEDDPIARLMIITASDVVSIYVENKGQAGSDLYLSIPLVDDLTQPYTGSPINNILTAFPITSPGQNLFIVGSAYDNTQVTLTIKTTGPFVHDTVTYNNGNQLVVTLRKGEALQIITDKDLTGTRVESTKPVGIFTGNTVQPTLEQVPPLSKWENLAAVGHYDVCSNITVRILVSNDATSITIRTESGSRVISKNAGEYYDHVQDKTTMVISSSSSLVGMRCTIGPGDQPIAMFLPPRSAFGTEFKCLTLSGYNNTAYAMGQHGLNFDGLYDVSGADTLFTPTYTLVSGGLSTMRANVPDGYLIIKSKDVTTMEPYIIGFSSNGAYGYACAKGTLGSLLPVSTLISTIDVTISTDLTTCSASTKPFSTITVSPVMQEVCFWKCGEDEILPNEALAFLQKYDKDVKHNLTLDEKTLSAYIRSKTSADDARPSARNVGYFGICMLCVGGCLIVLTDVLNLLKVVLHKQKNA